MPSKKDDDKTITITITSTCQRVTKDDLGDITRTVLEPGEVLKVAKGEGRMFIAAGRAREGDHGAAIKKARELQKKRAAA